MDVGHPGMTLKPVFNIRKKPWTVKALATFMAILYLSASFQLADLVQVFHHNHEQEALQGWACATHKCACKGPKECNLHCCCKMKGMDASDKSKPPREKDVLTWSQCTGPSGDLALSVLRLAPHFLNLAVLDPSASPSRAPRLLREDEVLFRPSNPLLKVPILSPLS